MKFSTKRKMVGLRNDFNNIRESVSAGIDKVISGLYLGAAIGTLAAIPILAVNTVVYAGLAGTEGVERACGISAQNQRAKLIEKQVALGPNGDRHDYATFKLADGKTITAYDSPVVTEGKFFPYNFNNLQINKTYDVKTFGWIVPSIVDAKEIK